MFISDDLKSILNNWIQFLVAIIKNEEIPQLSMMKDYSYLLMSLMLEPLTRLLDMPQQINREDDEEFTNTVNSAVQNIFLHISESFQFEKNSLVCAQEFCETLKKHHAVLIKDTLYLTHFVKLLSYDVSVAIFFFLL